MQMLAMNTGPHLALILDLTMAATVKHRAASVSASASASASEIDPKFRFKFFFHRVFSVFYVLTNIKINVRLIYVIKFLIDTFQSLTLVINHRSHRMLV